MSRGAILSAVLHLVVFALAYFGLPALTRSPPIVDLPVPVDVVTVAEKTNVPPPPPEEPKEPEAKPEPKFEPPTPEPKPPPPPEPEAVAPPEPPKPEPKPEPPKPEPPKVAEAPPPPRLPQALKDIRPQRKPPPPDPLASVLKSVEKLKTRAPETPAAQTAATEQRAPREFNAAAPITISHIDAIRRHFERCWNIPAGAREAENLVVNIRVQLGPDANVERAEIVERARMQIDPFYRAAAESALRAVLNPICRSLKDVGLPADRYDEWKDMTISFNPKQMIGA